jgi:hypothetical protein
MTAIAPLQPTGPRFVERQASASGKRRIEPGSRPVAPAADPAILPKASKA